MSASQNKSFGACLAVVILHWTTEFETLWGLLSSKLLNSLIVVLVFRILGVFFGPVLLQGFREE